jgi:hypothetical protein
MHAVPSGITRNCILKLAKKPCHVKVISPFGHRAATMGDRSQGEGRVQVRIFPCSKYLNSVRFILVTQLSQIK